MCDKGIFLPVDIEIQAERQKVVVVDADGVIANKMAEFVVGALPAAHVMLTGGLGAHAFGFDDPGGSDRNTNGAVLFEPRLAPCGSVLLVA